MKNPLIKRIPKELVGEFGKYLVIFLFLAASIGFISGFLVAGDSMIHAYNESFDKYNIENGNFELSSQITEQMFDKIQEEQVSIYENTYKEEQVIRPGGTESDSTIRIFADRKEVNRVCLMSGVMPKEDREIAIDRMYADNNKLKVGDVITVGGIQMTITGLVALSDYSALYSDNNDMMFDAVKFGTAIVTDHAFAEVSDHNIHYSYSWKYDEQPADEYEEKEKSDTFMKALVKDAAAEQIALENYIPEYDNQAIHFTGNDLGSDKSMMTVLLYILIAIIAFVFAVTTSNTITKEASVIGTLRASGYTKGEVICHYMAMPLIITVVASIVGNILGYTCFKNIVAGMYYGSYSLPTYETRWNAEAFVMTTVIPFVIMLVINLLIIARKMQLSPLRFLRHDLGRKSKKKAMRLPKFRFMNRFRLRIIIQNIPGYLMMFIGVLFANVLLLFGMMMSPLLTHYQNEIETHMIAEYQYILKGQVQTDTDTAEKYAVTSLKTIADDGDGESISVFGIQKDSSYVKVDFSSIQKNADDNSVYVSEGYLEKYGLKTGDQIRLKEEYGEKEYEFTIAAAYDYPAALVVFMDQDAFSKTFDKESGYFNGYFSEHEMTDIDEKYIAATITRDDLTKTSRQLEVSMGKMFLLVNVFAVVLFMLLIYLLSKLVIEKNSTAISMVKILGYTNSEARKLYMTTTSIVVMVSLLVSLPIDIQVIKALYHAMMMDYTGWLTLYISPVILVQMFAIGVVSYLILAVLLYQRITKIPMDEALKNVE